MWMENWRATRPEMSRYKTRDFSLPNRLQFLRPGKEWASAPQIACRVESECTPAVFCRLSAAICRTDPLSPRPAESLRGLQTRRLGAGDGRSHDSRSGA